MSDFMPPKTLPWLIHVVDDLVSSYEMSHILSIVFICSCVMKQALNPIENVIFQETMMEPWGALIVYAPIHASIVSQLAMGMDSTTIPILASGFAVNIDGPGRRAAPATTTGIPWSGGSFLTVGFQFLACSSLSTEDVGVDVIPTVHSFVDRTVRLIKAAFDC